MANATRKNRSSKASRKSSRKASRKSSAKPKTEWMMLVQKHIKAGLKFGDALKAAKKEYRK